MPLVASGCRGEAEGQWADFCHEDAAQVGDAEEGRGQCGVRWDLRTLRVGGGEGVLPVGVQGMLGRGPAWPPGRERIQPPASPVASPQQAFLRSYCSSHFPYRNTEAQSHKAQAVAHPGNFYPSS